MGFTMPPPPITQEDFRKRWEAGARTMAEIDPALAAWEKRNKDEARFQLICIMVGIVCIGLTVLMIVIWGG